MKASVNVGKQWILSQILNKGHVTEAGYGGEKFFISLTNCLTNYSAILHTRWWERGQVSVLFCAQGLNDLFD